MTQMLAYTPFVSPLPIWDWWALTIIPLSLALAIVYKAMKAEHIETVPRQALMIALWILGGMCAAAAVLVVIVKVL